MLYNMHKQLFNHKGSRVKENLLTVYIDRILHRCKRKKYIFAPQIHLSFSSLILSYASCQAPKCMLNM